MDKKDTEDITFMLLANPSKLKKKKKKEIINKDDYFFAHIKKMYPGMFILNSNKHYILEKIETLLTDITISNIVENIIREIEYEQIL